MDKILTLLQENPRLTNAQIAAMTGLTEDETGERIAAYERMGVIAGYKTVLNEEKLARQDKVTAVIQLKVTPRRDTGFEVIAREIMAFEEVEAVSLMSGGYDFLVRVTGATFQEIALFVAMRLAPMENVVSTATAFVLKKYKEDGLLLSGGDADERGADFL